jgi:type IV pilus assembly protein PilY1
VIVPTGYNSTSTKGKIFFLDPETGTKLAELETPGDSDGFAHISGYTKDYRNQFVEQIYGGDLNGNLWRFDVSDPDPAKWAVVKFAKLTDAGGTGQPVTTPPQIEVDTNNGVDRWVFIGTGRLLHKDDQTDTQIQAMYAIRDGTGGAPATITAPVTRSDLVVVSGIGGLSSTPDRGWYDTLAANERIVTAVQAEASLVAYAATLPASTDKCAPGQPAKIFAREYSRGKSQLRPSAGGAYVESVTVDQGVAGMDVIALEKVGSLPGSYFPDVRIAVTQQKDGELQVIRVEMPTVASRHRMSWRLIPY